MALVGPHTDELKGLAFENVRLCVHQVHCDLGEVTQVELVVELAGCGHELWASSDHSENFGGSIDNSLIVTFECAIEVFEVVCEDLTEDSSKDVLFWNTESNHGEVTCETEVNVERTGLGVHAGDEHDVVDFFLVFEVVSVEHNLIVDDLADQANRRLGSVLVDLRHVKIVHEEH